MISVREGWSAVLTPLPMTRRHDAVGAANWSAEGGASMNARGGTGGAGTAALHAAVAARHLTATALPRPDRRPSGRRRRCWHLNIP